jgi:hypothetical protein
MLIDNIALMANILWYPGLSAAHRGGPELTA